MPLDPLTLSDVLTARVGESDLRAIVFRLRLRYEDLAGATLGEKTLALIQYHDDRQRLDALSAAVLHVRPDLHATLSPAVAPPAPAPASSSPTGPACDVFLAHHSQDKPQVAQLAALLRARGVLPWLDSEQIAPGSLWQNVLQAALTQVKAAAVLLGTAGPGRWQALEIPVLVSQCVEQGIRVIPVLLPGVSGIPEDLPFLKQFHAVRFPHSRDDPDALAQLLWGITGQRTTVPGGSA